MTIAAYSARVGANGHIFENFAAGMTLNPKPTNPKP